MKFPKTQNLGILLESCHSKPLPLEELHATFAIPQRKKAIGKGGYGVFRIHVGFTNINLTLTTLTGQVLSWTNGGTTFANQSETRRTRMTGRAVKNLTVNFLNSKRGSQRLIQQLRYIKVLFTGPSKRYRGKFLSLILKNYKQKVRVLCKEEGFRRSFNGCRLARKKR